jgi:hypothetical protein
MKKPLFFSLVLAFGLVWGIKAEAQNDDHIKTPEEKAEARTKIMTCELNLTDAEIPKVYAINLKTAKSLDSAVEALHGHQGRINAFGTKLDKARDVAMRRAMTADQYSTYLSLIDGDPVIVKRTAPCRPDQQKH